MAKCEWCKREMSPRPGGRSTDTCTANVEVEYPDGTKLPSLTDHFDEPDGRCHDCGIKHGGRHHPGCDVEHCPRCGGLLIACGCLDEKSGE